MFLWKFLPRVIALVALYGLGMWKLLFSPCADVPGLCARGTRQPELPSLLTFLVVWVSSVVQCPPQGKVGSNIPSWSIVRLQVWEYKELGNSLVHISDWYYFSKDLELFLLWPPVACESLLGPSQEREREAIPSCLEAMCLCPDKRKTNSENPVGGYSQILAWGAGWSS